MLQKTPVSHTVRAIKTLKLASEAPAKLRDKLQVRKSSNAMGMNELKASIAHNGVIFPLVVNGDYVIAGNRRLEALRSLYPDGEFTVPVCDASDFGGDVREIALATNVALPMHPVDRYEVLASLVADGVKPEEVSAHYGLDDRAFAQTMKLAMLSPRIRDAWREGEIGSRAAQAFTLTDDHAAQERLLKRLQKDFGPDREIGEHSVRNALRNDKQQDVAKLLNVAGVEAYKTAGGVITEDLFGDDHSVSDMKLLTKLADERIAAEIKRLTEDEGWGFAVLATNTEPPNRWSYGLISKPYTAEKKAGSGVFITIDRAGDLQLEFGKTKPKAAAGKAAKTTSAKGAKTGSKSEPAAPAVISNALGTRLSLMLRAATQETLKIVGKAAGGLTEQLCKVVAEQMEHNFTVQSAAVDFRKHVAAKTFNEAMAKNFDADDYFSNAPKKFLLDALKDVGLFEQAKKIAKTSELRKFAIKHVTPTGWLPRELRTPHYAQPKKAKA